MTRILIPRSSTSSAKKVEASDWEKYFNADIINDYVISGLVVSEQCPDILGINIASGSARIKGLFACNSVTCTVNCLTACSTNKIYLKICRDACCEADEWTFGKTTGCVPACGYHIANVVTAATTVTSVCQSSTIRINKNLFGFVGTGTQINAICPTFAGMKAFSLNTSSCFVTGRTYVRDETNAVWLDDTHTGFYGTGADGCVTISCNTDLGACNHKNYRNLTVNNGIILQMNSGALIKVSGTLTFGNTCSTIHVNEKGGAGGAAQATAPKGPPIILQALPVALYFPCTC